MKSKAVINLSPVMVRATGRFRSILHTGHEYDKFGNITRHGIVLHETPFGRNTITLTGFNTMLGGNPANMCMVAGAGNTPPAETDSALTSYLGVTQSVASSGTTRNITPDVNDEVWWRKTVRMTFGPGTLGGGSVNVAEAGITLGLSPGSVSSSTPIAAHGLLVDDGGVPTTVSVDNAVEYLDIIWEYTEWIKASVLGSVNLTIDDVVTAFDYEVRPNNFQNEGGSFNYGGWQNIGATSLPSFGLNVSTSGYPRSYSTCPFEQGVTDITGDLPNSVTNDIPIGAVDAYVANSKQRTFKLTWLPVRANFATGIGVLRVNLGHSNWQVGFTPKIAKVATKQLDMNFTFSMANR